MWLEEKERPHIRTTLTRVTGISVLVRLFDFLFHFSEFLLERTFGVRHFTHLCLSVSTVKQQKENWLDRLISTEMRESINIKGWPKYVIFECSLLVTSFPCLLPFTSVYMFSRACHWLQVFPRFLPFSCFPALATGYMFSRAFCRFHVFPRLPLVTCFPALSAVFMFSRAFRRYSVFTWSYSP